MTRHTAEEIAAGVAFTVLMAVIFAAFFIVGG